MNSALKRVIFWILMAVLTVIVWAIVKTNTSGTYQELTFLGFMTEVNHDNVREVTIADTEAAGILKKADEHFHTTLPPGDFDLYRTLLDRNVNVSFKDSQSGSWITWLLNATPMLILLGLWIYFARAIKGGSPYKAIQAKHLEMLEQQSALIRETNDLLKKLVERV